MLLPSTVFFGSGLGDSAGSLGMKSARDIQLKSIKSGFFRVLHAFGKFLMLS